MRFSAIGGLYLHMALVVSSPPDASVFFNVAILAEQLKIVEVERDLRVVDVLRCEVDLVVHLFAWSYQALCQASLTQPATVCLVCPRALDPRP